MSHSWRMRVVPQTCGYTLLVCLALIKAYADLINRAWVNCCVLPMVNVRIGHNLTRKRLTRSGIVDFHGQDKVMELELAYP